MRLHIGTTNLRFAYSSFWAPWRESKVFSSPGGDRTENVTATDRLVITMCIIERHDG